jgi:hypothetical protein
MAYRDPALGTLAHRPRGADDCSRGVAGGRRDRMMYSLYFGGTHATTTPGAETA